MKELRKVMYKSSKIITSGCIGGAVGFSVWAILYIAHKTPAIGFDGPAGMAMLASTASGFIIFGLIGSILSLLKKLQALE